MALGGGGIQRRNPCPQCGAVPQLVAGVILRQDVFRNYLICWPCGQVRKVVVGSEWVLMPTAHLPISLPLEDEDDRREDDRPRRRKRRRRW